MPKRGIDTPAKDDSNRKKPKKSPEENTDVAESKPKPSSPASAHTASKPPVSAPTPICSSKGAKAASVSAAIKPKHAPATSNLANSMGGSLLDIFRSGGSGEKASSVKKEKDSANNHARAVADDKKVEPKAKAPDGKADIKKETDSKETSTVHKRSMWGIGAVAALGALNIASVTYLVSEQSRFNTAQMRCRVENEKLASDLTRNQGIISVLRSGLDAAENQIKFIEQAQESKRKALQERRDKKASESPLTDEEKSKWELKKESLMKKRGELLDNFNIWLAKLDAVDGME